MQISPYVNFNGQCEAAFKFYEQLLGGKITFKMIWGEMPGGDQLPAEAHKLIMHETLTVGDDILSGADAPAGRYQQAKGGKVTLRLEDVGEGEDVFNSLAE